MLLTMPVDELPLWKVAQWWAQQNCEVQAEFLSLLESHLMHECKSTLGMSNQLHSIGKELGRDRHTSVRLALENIVDAATGERPC